MRKPSLSFRVRSFLASLVQPHAREEDLRRRELILNILLLSSIVLLSVCVACTTTISLFVHWDRSATHAVSFVGLAVVLLALVVLWQLSRSGGVRLASKLLVSVFAVLSLYFSHRWGLNVTVGMLFYALTILLAGLLLSARAAFIAAALFGLLLPALHYLQSQGVIAPNSYWRTESFIFSDALVIIATFVIIATVSWLSNREVEKSLARARASEAALVLERDLLEERVQKRTQELRAAQLENMRQTYRFVEFGRMAGGIFHDLTNPLTALSLNIRSMADSHGSADPAELSRMRESLANAQKAAEHMERLMASMRKHLSSEGEKEAFLVRGCLHELVEVLGTYARQRGVSLAYEAPEDLRIHGDPIMFTQVVTNIASNAIESFAQGAACGSVVIAARQEERCAVIEVRDTGPGMPGEVASRIFEPFFSTKGRTSMGVGLPLAQRIVEKEFGGSLQARSRLGEGTVFTVRIPVSGILGCG